MAAPDGPAGGRVELRVFEKPSGVWMWRAQRGLDFLIHGNAFPSREAALENARAVFSGDLNGDLRFPKSGE